MATLEHGRRLLGRRDESAVMDELVASVRAGLSRALVLRGEAGVGKSALLEYPRRSHATGLHVSRAWPASESEVEFAYAGLQPALLAVHWIGLEQAPGPAARRVGDGARPSPTAARPTGFLVEGLAVLSLLSDAAEDRAAASASLDDARWLDAASVRLSDSWRVGCSPSPIGSSSRCASRAAHRDLVGLSELVSPRLERRRAAPLLARMLSRSLDARVGDRIVAETGGNPLAIMELPRGLVGRTGGWLCAS